MRADATFPSGVGKRDSPRLKLNIRGRLSSARGTQIVELLDLSQTGVRLALSASANLNEADLEWLDFKARGVVVWQDRRLCGLRFEGDIPLAWVITTRAASKATTR